MEQATKVTRSPDAIIIPTAGTVKGIDGTFHSTTYEDGDAFGVLGGYVRVIAAAILADEYPHSFVVTTGKGAGDGVTPTHAEIMKKELIELGVEPQRVILEENSTSSKSGITEAFALAEKKGWKSFLFVTNEYHIARFRLMVEMALPHIDVEYISAEEVIVSAKPSFREVFEKVMSSPSYEKRVESELRGIEALKAGTYKEAPVEDKKERLV